MLREQGQGRDGVATTGLTVGDEAADGRAPPRELKPAPHRTRRRGGAASAGPGRGRAGAAQASEDAAAEALLAKLLPRFLACQHEYDTARQYANVVWALGAMGSTGPTNHPQVLAAVASQLLQLDASTSASQQAPSALDPGAPVAPCPTASPKLASAPPQELSNLALGLAKLGYGDVGLWGALIAAAKPRLQQFKPQELHNLAWAVAAASQDRSCIAAVVQAALPRLTQFNVSGLASLLWACAAAQCPCAELFDGAAEVLLAAPAGEWNSQDVANTAWAFAKLEHPHPRLFAHLGQLLLAAGRDGGLQHCSAQELSNVMWAFAAASPEGLLPVHAALPAAGGAWPGGGGSSGAGPGQAAIGRGFDPTRSSVDGIGEGQPNALLQALFALLLPEIVQRAGPDLSPLASAAALWSCGRVQPCPLPAKPLGALLASVEAAALGGPAALGDQALCSALWGAGRLRRAGHWVSTRPVLCMLQAACAGPRLEAMAPTGLVQLTCGAVWLRLLSPAQMDPIAVRVLAGAQAGAFEPPDLSALACAAAEAAMVARYVNPPLLGGLGDAVAACAASLSPSCLSGVLWAYARAQHYHGPLTSSVCRAAAGRLREFSDQELACLAAALAVLRCPGERQLLERVARAVGGRLRWRGQQRQRQAGGGPGPGVGAAGSGIGAGAGAGLGQGPRGQAGNVLARSGAGGVGDGAAASGRAGLGSSGGGSSPCPGSSVRASAPSTGQCAAGLASAASRHPDDSSPTSSRDEDTGGGQAASLRRAPRPPDNGSLLRRLPLLHAADVPLQPRRPPPRDACAGSGRGGGPGHHSHPDGPQSGALGSGTGEQDPGAGAGGTALAHAKSMARFLWSFAKSDLYHPPLYRLLAAELAPVVGLLTPHELTQVVWAVATTEHRCPELLAAVTRAVTAPHRLRRLCAWDGSVVAWAAAKLQATERASGGGSAWPTAGGGACGGAALLEALQRHALHHAPYPEPCLCRLAWACAQLGVPISPPLMRQLHDMRQAALGGQRRAGRGGGTEGAQAAGVATSSYDGLQPEHPARLDPIRAEPEWC